MSVKTCLKCLTAGIEPALGTSIEMSLSRNPPVGWAIVVPRISSMTRICFYDRAGLGASSALAAAVTSRDAARDSNELLAGLEVQPPYVMVGHSLGGMDAIDAAAADRVIQPPICHGPLQCSYQNLPRTPTMIWRPGSYCVNVA